jgi:hypothetical protein
MTLAVAALLSSAVLAKGDYKNITGVDWDVNLPC